MRVCNDNHTSFLLSFCGDIGIPASVKRAGASTMVEGEGHGPWERRPSSPGSFKSATEMWDNGGVPLEMDARSGDNTSLLGGSRASGSAQGLTPMNYCRYV